MLSWKQCVRKGGHPWEPNAYHFWRRDPPLDVFFLQAWSGRRCFWWPRATLTVTTLSLCCSSPSPLLWAECQRLASTSTTLTSLLRKRHSALPSKYSLGRNITGRSCFWKLKMFVAKPDFTSCEIILSWNGILPKIMGIRRRRDGSWVDVIPAWNLTRHFWLSILISWIEK